MKSERPPLPKQLHTDPPVLPSLTRGIEPRFDNPRRRNGDDWGPPTPSHEIEDGIQDLLRTVPPVPTSVKPQQKPAMRKPATVDDFARFVDDMRVRDLRTICREVLDASSGSRIATLTPIQLTEMLADWAYARLEKLGEVPITPPPEPPTVELRREESVFRTSDDPDSRLGHGDNGADQEEGA